MQPKTIIIGATGAVGSVLAENLAGEGLSLHLIGRNPAELQELAAHTGSTFDALDVTDFTALQTVVATVAADFGVNGLVYAAGSIVLKPLKLAKEEDFSLAFALNVTAAAMAVKAAATSLAQHNGSVVFFSSVAAQHGFKNHSVIASAKAGVEGLTRALASELAPKVRVNCIAPSLTPAKMSSAMTDNPKIADSIAAMHPLKRLGEAQETASLAGFLLSPKAAWITGQVIHIDGGRAHLDAA